MQQWMKCRNEMKFKIIKQWKWTANSIRTEGALKISESLMTNTTLTKFYLEGDDNIVWNVNNSNY